MAVLRKMSWFILGAGAGSLYFVITSAGDFTSDCFGKGMQGMCGVLTGLTNLHFFIFGIPARILITPFLFRFDGKLYGGMWDYFSTWLSSILFFGFLSLILGAMAKTRPRFILVLFLLFMAGMAVIPFLFFQ